MFARLLNFGSPRLIMSASADIGLLRAVGQLRAGTTGKVLHHELGSELHERASEECFWAHGPQVYRAWGTAARCAPPGECPTMADLASHQSSWPPWPSTRLLLSLWLLHTFGRLRAPVLSQTMTRSKASRPASFHPPINIKEAFCFFVKYCRRSTTGSTVYTEQK